MVADGKSVFWYVLFAANGKAAKISGYFKEAGIEHFFPLRYKERRINNSKRQKYTMQPLIGNLVFVKSSIEVLMPHLKEIKQRLVITSDLYYRDLGTREIVVIPETQMKNFISVAGCMQERVIYLSNKEINLKKGTKVRITGGLFEGLEGIFMRIKGERRVVVSLPGLLSVATAFISIQFILPLE